MKAVAFTNAMLASEDFEKTLTLQGDLARLARLIDKAKKGEKIVIAGLGGSITEGMSALPQNTKCYMALVTAWFESEYPAATVEYVNAGIGSTGSIIGVARMDKDLLKKKPDLVIVDFACNDSKKTNLETEAYEGVVRRILSQPQQPAVMTIFFTNDTFDTVQAKETTIARKYKIPAISYKDGVQSAIRSGTKKWQNFSSDAVHPNNKGHELAADLIIHRIRVADQYLNEIDRTVPPLPETKTRFDQSSLLNNKNINALSVGAFAASPNTWPNEALKYGWVAKEVDKPLVFETEAQVLTLVYKMLIHTANQPARGALLDVYIDGKKVKTLDADFPDGWGEYPELITVLDRSEQTKVKVELKLSPNSPANTQFMLLAILQS